MLKWEQMWYFCLSVCWFMLSEAHYQRQMPKKPIRSRRLRWDQHLADIGTIVVEPSCRSHVMLFDIMSMFIICMCEDDNSRSSGTGPGSGGLRSSLERYREGGKAFLSSVCLHTTLPRICTGLHHTCELHRNRDLSNVCLSVFFPVLSI